jgi:hypothetical protein
MIMKTVVRAAYGYAKRNGMKELFLTDQSSIRCPEWVPLADLSFLTTGQTWYEPLIPGLYCLSPTHDIEHLRQRAHAATWATVGADLLPELSVPDSRKEGSAMKVLDYLKKTHDYCHFFSVSMTQLVARSYGQSIQETLWKCDIPQANLRKSTLRRRNISTHFSRSAKTNRIFTTPYNP